MKEKTINVKDLIEHILLKWRFVLIVTVLCALIFPAIGGAYSFKLAEEAEKELAVQLSEGSVKDGEELIVVPQTVIYDFKYIIVGIFAGVLFSVEYIVIMYVASKKIRTKRDVEILGIKRVDTISLKKNFSRKIEQVISTTFNREQNNLNFNEKINKICEDIISEEDFRLYEKLFLLTSCEERYVEEIMDIISGELKTKVKMVSCGKAITKQSKSLKQLVDSDAVILVEEMDCSRIDEIEKEIKFCVRYEVPVIKCILLD